MDDMDLICNFHISPLKSTKISLKCNACYEDHHDNNQGYKCDLCDFYVNEECMNTNIPSRHKHPLKLRPIDVLSSCCLCETNLCSQIFYHCSQCSFSICIPCARKPLIIHRYKTHEHELHQIPIRLSFTCDACGLCSTGCPYICDQCCFIIHKACIFLPRVIYINRHDHRISHVSSLGPGKWTCGVCHELVNGQCGAYSCLVCPKYVVHSKCATLNFRDEKELEGIPEKEDSKPFEVIGQNVIKHFSHEHNLIVSSLRHKEEDGLPHEEGKNCYACTLPLPLYSKLCYECTQCDYVLHDTCANLPLKKRYLLTQGELTLCAKGRIRNLFFCTACQRYCNGFSYTDSEDRLNRLIFDVRCASISVPFKHGSHPHWLFLSHYEVCDEICEGCSDPSSFWYLRCNGKDACGFNICFRCATLPTLVRHKYDDHPLYLYYGQKNEISTYWCGLCEEEIDSKNWFYKCDDCGSTLHTRCAFQNLILSRPGYSSIVGDMEMFNFLRNNRLSRPICSNCKTRCMDDLFLKDKEYTKLFLCNSCSYKLYHGLLPEE